jgi:hypothetical protein
MDKIDSEERRERIKDRCMDQASSAWWSYNQHFKAANFNKFLGYGFSALVAVLGGILSYGLIWDGVPDWLMIVLAVSVSVASGLELILSPSDKRERLADSAHEYQALFDDVVDFLELELPRNDRSTDDLDEEYEELRQRRRELNDETPDVSSFWYLYVKWRKGSDGMKEAFSGDAEEELFEQ